MLGELGFHYEGDQRFQFPTQVSPALPAKVDNIVNDGGNDRVMVEGCTNPDSLMSRLTPSSKGCTVIPIDRNIDWCSKESYDICIGNLTGGHRALWFSSPCTGGSVWSHIHLHRSSSTVALILSHWKEFHRLWKRFEEIAKIVIPKGVAMFVEWPRGCRYWANKRVARFLDTYGFTFADFDGCMYGLVATKGKEVGTPIKKPWRVAYVNYLWKVWVLALTPSAMDLISIPLVLDRIPLLLRAIPRRSSALYMGAFAMMLVVAILYLRTLPPPCLCTLVLLTS